MSVAPAFTDLSTDSAINFRILLDCMARPGTIGQVAFDATPLEKIGTATLVAALTLADHESPVWLDEPLRSNDIMQFIRFHCGSPIVAAPEEAAFAIFAGCPSVEVLDQFAIGTPEYPDRSATLIVAAEALETGGNIVLAGPGIKVKRHISVDGLDSAFWTWLRANNARFPLGVDVLLTSGKNILALPRSVQILETI